MRAAYRREVGLVDLLLTVDIGRLCCGLRAHGQFGRGFIDAEVGGFWRRPARDFEPQAVDHGFGDRAGGVLRARHASREVGLDDRPDPGVVQLVPHSILGWGFSR
jgi:hypothetical protein